MVTLLRIEREQNSSKTKAKIPRLEDRFEIFKTI